MPQNSIKYSLLQFCFELPQFLRSNLIGMQTLNENEWQEFLVSKQQDAHEWKEEYENELGMRRNWDKTTTTTITEKKTSTSQHHWQDMHAHKLF